jgi:hypothetical protein
MQACGRHIFHGLLSVLYFTNVDKNTMENKEEFSKRRKENCKSPNLLFQGEWLLTF